MVSTISRAPPSSPWLTEAPLVLLDAQPNLCPIPCSSTVRASEHSRGWGEAFSCTLCLQPDTAFGRLLFAWSTPRHCSLKSTQMDVLSRPLRGEGDSQSRPSLRRLRILPHPLVSSPQNAMCAGELGVNWQEILFSLPSYTPAC